MLTPEYIELFLQHHKITANALAERAGVRPFSLYRFLKKKGDISRKTESKLSRAIEKITKQAA